MFEFRILAKDKKSKARVGQFSTNHGKLLTPNLSFVATEGELKSIPKKTINKLPVHSIIVNTFHIFTKNILKNMQKVGGIHKYTGFSKVIESDSGGFQVFSLGFGRTHKIGKIANIFPGKNLKADDKNNSLLITENGVTFDWEGQKIILTPEKSMQIQQKIGADIIFAFDECTSPLNSHEYTKKAMERTHRWLSRCLKAKISILNDLRGADPERVKRAEGEHAHRVKNAASSFQNHQALFGIIQGGYFEDLRKTSAKFVAKQDVPGFGIGGSFGPTKENMYGVLQWTIPLLPDEKPRHFLGIGTVRDIFASVELGVDLFDCVIPTREARHKVLYTANGRMNLKKMKSFNEPIEKNCKCQTCREKITTKQLYQLFLQKDRRAYFFATVHNIQFYSDLMRKIRDAIEQNKLQELKDRYLKYY